VVRVGNRKRERGNRKHGHRPWWIGYIGGIQIFKKKDYICDHMGKGVWGVAVPKMALVLLPKTALNLQIKTYQAV